MAEEETVICQFSDPHLAAPLPWGEINFRRLLARANWRLFRGRRHAPERLERLAARLAELRPDAVVATGDLGQCGTRAEFARFREALRPLTAAGVPVLFCDGNHDHYGGAAAAAELRELRRELSLGLLRDDAAVARTGRVELAVFSQGEPGAPFASRGRVKEEELARAAEQLATGGGVRVAAGHFPLVAPGGGALPQSKCLRDGEALLRFLQEHRFAAYLCGHVHEAFSEPLPGGCVQHCAGSCTGAGVCRVLRAGENGLRIETLAV